MKLTMKIDDGPEWIVDTGRAREDLKPLDIELIVDEIHPGTWARIKYLVIKEFFGGRG